MYAQHVPPLVLGLSRLPLQNSALSHESFDPRVNEPMPCHMKNQKQSILVSTQFILIGGVSKIFGKERPQK